MCQDFTSDTTISLRSVGYTVLEGYPAIVIHWGLTGWCSRNSYQYNNTPVYLYVYTRRGFSSHFL